MNDPFGEKRDPLVKTMERSVIRKAIADAREECARVADEISEKHFKASQGRFGQPGEGREIAASDAADEVANAIRALNSSCM